MRKNRRTTTEAMLDTNADGSYAYRPQRKMAFDIESLSPLEEIKPGEAVDLCARVAAALRLAAGQAFQDRNAWEKLARALAKRFDTFQATPAAPQGYRYELIRIATKEEEARLNETPESGCRSQ